MKYKAKVTVAGGSKMPFCSEAWDAISRIYLYGTSRRFDNEGRDVERKRNDNVLFRRYAPGNF